MVYKILFLSFFCSTIICSCINAQMDIKREYELVWQDDFNGNTIDTCSWSFMKRIPYNCGRYWSDHAKLYRVSGGKLRIFARRNNGIAPNDTAQYLTGGLTTQNKRYVGYGKIEVRARVKGAQGTWPAIWTLREDGKNDTRKKGYAELDIMEYVNRNKFAYQTIHTYYTLQQGSKGHQIKADINYGKWNVYAVEILPDCIIYSVNGHDTCIYTKDPFFEAEGQWPFGIDMYLMMDMQVGGSWVGHVDPKSFPAYMDIDWVRMYKWKGINRDNVLK